MNEDWFLLKQTAELKTSRCWFCSVALATNIKECWAYERHSYTFSRSHFWASSQKSSFFISYIFVTHYLLVLTFFLWKYRFIFTWFFVFSSRRSFFYFTCLNLIVCCSFYPSPLKSVCFRRFALWSNVYDGENCISSRNINRFIKREKKRFFAFNFVFLLNSYRKRRRRMILEIFQCYNIITYRFPSFILKNIRSAISMQCIFPRTKIFSWIVRRNFYDF